MAPEPYVTQTLCVWPCLTWCFPDELSQMSHMSDDFTRMYVPGDYTSEDIEQFLFNLHKSEH